MFSFTAKTRLKNTIPYLNNALTSVKENEKKREKGKEKERIKTTSVIFTIKLAYIFIQSVIFIGNRNLKRGRKGSYF